MFDSILIQPNGLESILKRTSTGSFLTEESLITSYLVMIFLLMRQLVLLQLQPLVLLHHPQHHLQLMDLSSHIMKAKMLHGTVPQGLAQAIQEQLEEPTLTWEVLTRGLNSPMLIVEQVVFAFFHSVMQMVQPMTVSALSLSTEIALELFPSPQLLIG